MAHPLPQACPAATSPPRTLGRAGSGCQAARLQFQAMYLHLHLYLPANTNRALNATARHSPVPQTARHRRQYAANCTAGSASSPSCLVRTEQPVHRPAHDARPRTQPTANHPRPVSTARLTTLTYVYVPAIPPSYIHSHAVPLPHPETTESHFHQKHYQTPIAKHPQAPLTSPNQISTPPSPPSPSSRQTSFPLHTPDPAAHQTPARHIAHPP
jgi:hypothetical protein